MAFTFPLDRTLLSPPGDTIQETLDTIGMTQLELSTRMGRPKEKINELIKGKGPLTIDTAIMLERVLGIPVQFWIKREGAYRETLARIEEKEALERNLSWLNLFPLKALHALQVISSSQKNAIVIREMLQFFRFASPLQWNNYYLESSNEVSFRISLKDTPSPGAVAAWLRLGEKQAELLNLPAYSEKKFRDQLKQIRQISYIQPDDFLKALQSIGADCGVAIISTPSFPNAKISGAARWLDQTPLIQLSDLYKTNDQFWFSFFHEACHILEHGKKDIFLEKLVGATNDTDKEKEANEFAANFLIPLSAYKTWSNKKFFNEDTIRSFAHQIGIHPGIVVGRLQYDGKLKAALFNQLKVSISFTKTSTFYTNSKVL